jgi:hypothetical protein
MNDYTLEEQIAAVKQEIANKKVCYGEHSNHHGVLVAILQTLEEMQRCRVADIIDSGNARRRLNDLVSASITRDG